MTEPDPAQPQPVVWAAHLAGLVSGAFVACSGLFFWFKDGSFTQGNLTQAGNLIALAVTAVLAVGSYVLTLLHGKAAAKLVTPLSSPRDDAGNWLVPETDYDTAPMTVTGPVTISANSDAAARASRDVSAAAQVRAGLDYIRDRYGSDDGDHSASMGPDLPAEPPTEDSLLEQWDADFQQWKATRFHHDDTQEMPVTEPEIPAVTDEPTRRIPERVVPGKRLGRHVRHDPRSLSYLVPPTSTPTTAMWTRRVPVFDQGNLGSCTGNAAAGVLGTDPFYATLPAGLTDDEKEAVSLYSAATSLDDYSGAYPPDDTGSDGLSVAKACQRAGLISGYQHITSVAAAQTAIKSGPFIVGVNWYTSMDNPDANGLVKVSGSIRGGHEFECHGYDATADLWWFTNSWGPSWGKAGTFCMSSASFARLLSEQGDATVFLPVVPVPAPQPPAPPAPTPVPVPTPAPVAPPQDVLDLLGRILVRKGSPKEDVKAANDALAWIASLTS